MSSLEAPNYTQIPNLLFDKWMSILSMPEFKVMMCLCRKIFGWHKTTDAISANQLCKVTGLSKPTVILALKGLEKHGLVLKTMSTYEFGCLPNEFRINVAMPTDENYSDYSLEDRKNNGREVIKSECGGGKGILPGVVKEIDQGVVKGFYPQKKDLTKEKKEIIVRGQAKSDKSDDHFFSFSQKESRQHNLHQQTSLETSTSKFSEDSDAFKLAQYFESSIKSHIPDLSKKNLQAWSKHFDLLLRVDKRDPSEIKSIIDWLPTDSFNCDKVLSAEKLRARYEELRSQSKKSPHEKVSVEKNKHYAKQLSEAFVSEYYIIEVLSAHVEFVPKTGNHPGSVVLYTAKKFRDDVKNLIQKHKFTVIKRKQ